MTIHISDNLVIIEGGTLTDGILYHDSFPQNGASGFHEVVEVEPPTIDSTELITGYRVDVIEGVRTQVWETRDKTEEEYAPELLSAKQAKKNEIEMTYYGFSFLPILFTRQGSTEKLYDADYNAMMSIMQVLTLSTETPDGFYWRLSDNSREMPFLRADVQALANAIGARNVPYFQNRSDKKDAIELCETVEEVNDIEW